MRTNIVLLIIYCISLAACNDASDLNNIPGPAAGQANLDPMWVTIDANNEGQTAHDICVSLGYSEAAIGRRCTDGSEYIMNDPTYTHPNCFPEATNYSQCFNFNSCGNTNSSGVSWDSIYCQ